MKTINWGERDGTIWCRDDGGHRLCLLFSNFNLIFLLFPLRCHEDGGNQFFSILPPIIPLRFRMAVTNVVYIF
jgi:hypothetical protein